MNNDYDPRYIHCSSLEFHSTKCEISRLEIRSDSSCPALSAGEPGGTSPTTSPASPFPSREGPSHPRPARCHGAAPAVLPDRGTQSRGQQRRPPAPWRDRRPPTIPSLHDSRAAATQQPRRTSANKETSGSAAAPPIGRRARATKGARSRVEDGQERPPDGIHLAKPTVSGYPPCVERRTAPGVGLRTGGNRPARRPDRGPPS